MMSEEVEVVTKCLNVEVMEMGMDKLQLDQGCPNLGALLSLAKVGNELMLQRTIHSIKGYLNDKTVAVDSLLRQGEKENDFVSVVVNCLKSKNVVAQLDAILVLNLVVDGISSSQKKQILGVGTNVFATLIKVLKSDNQSVIGSALKTLAIISDDDEFAFQIQNTDVISILLKVVKGKPRNLELLKCVAKVAYNFCEIFDETKINTIKKPRKFTGKHKKRAGDEGVNVFPVCKLVELCGILLRLKNDMISKYCMLIISDINLIVKQEERFKATIAGGLAPLMVSLLNHPNPDLRVVASMAVSSVADTNCLETILEFLQALKGSDGMKNFYSCLFHTTWTEPNEMEEINIANLVKAFFLLIRKTMECEKHRTAMVKAVMDCGFYHTLIRCLEPATDTSYLLENAIYMLQVVTNEKKQHFIRPIVHGGALPLLIRILKEEERGEKKRRYQICVWTVLTISDLVFVNNKCGEELVLLGGLQKMLELLQIPDIEMKICAAVIGCLDVLLEVCSHRMVRFESYSELLPGLELIMHKLMTFDDEEIGMFIKAKIMTCVGSLGKKYGNPALELLRERGWFERVVNSLAVDAPSCPSFPINRNVQHAALQGLILECVNNAKYREVLMELEILEYFPLLIQNHVNEVKLGAMTCLSLFMMEINWLNCERFAIIESMVPFIEAEKMKGSLENRVAAKILLKNIERYRKNNRKMKIDVHI